MDKTIPKSLSKYLGGRFTNQIFELILYVTSIPQIFHSAPGQRSAYCAWDCFESNIVQASS